MLWISGNMKKDLRVLWSKELNLQPLSHCTEQRTPRGVCFRQITWLNWWKPQSEVETKNTYWSIPAGWVLQKQNSMHGCLRHWKTRETITEYQASEKLHSFREQRNHFKGDEASPLSLLPWHVPMHYTRRTEGSGCYRKKPLPAQRYSGGQYPDRYNRYHPYLSQWAIWPIEERRWLYSGSSRACLSQWRTAVFKEGKQ